MNRVMRWLILVVGALTVFQLGLFLDVAFRDPAVAPGLASPALAAGINSCSICCKTDIPGGDCLCGPCYNCVIVIGAPEPLCPIYY